MRLQALTRWRQRTRPEEDDLEDRLERPAAAVAPAEATQDLDEDGEPSAAAVAPAEALHEDLVEEARTVAQEVEDEQLLLPTKVEHIHLDPVRQRIRCGRCEAEDIRNNKGRFFRLHQNCQRQKKRSNRGPTPRFLPPYLVRSDEGESEVGSGARVMCTRCGARPHWGHLASFVVDHAQCDE